MGKFVGLSSVFLFLLGVLLSGCAARVSGSGEPAIQRSAKASNGAPRVRSLTLNQAMDAQLSQQSVEYFELAIPSGVEAVAVRLADRSDPSACEDGSEDVKAFISLSNPKPSIWNHSWVLNMCDENPIEIADLPLEQDRRLFVGVFVAVSAEYSILVSGIEPSLSTGITLRLRRGCEPKEERVSQLFGEEVVEFAIPIPKEVMAVNLSAHLDSSLLTSVSLSTTVSNLTKHPATWIMSTNLHFSPVTLSRGDPGFCKVEPCVLYVRLSSAAVRGGCCPATQPNCYYNGDSVLPTNAVYSLTVRATDPIPRLRLYPTLALRGPSCAPGCFHAFVDDGICDEACFTPGCAFDGEDCEDSSRNNCAAGCKWVMLGDGICDEACYLEQCQWDKRDCFRYLREVRMNRAFTEEEAGKGEEQEKEQSEQQQEDSVVVELAA